MSDVTQINEIRRDLWNTMSKAELLHQQTLLMDRVSALIILAGCGNTATVTNMRIILDDALNQLNDIIYNT